MSSIPVAIQFSKTNELVFISHLDVMRLFARIFRRINLPLLYTQGFNPRPKFSFARALALGVKSKKEVMTIYLTEYIDLKKAKVDSNALLPKGIKISKIAYQRKK